MAKTKVCPRSSVPPSSPKQSKLVINKIPQSEVFVNDLTPPPPPSVPPKDPPCSPPKAMNFIDIQQPRPAGCPTFDGTGIPLPDTMPDPAAEQRKQPFEKKIHASALCAEAAIAAGIEEEK